MADLEGELFKNWVDRNASIFSKFKGREGTMAYFTFAYGEEVRCPWINSSGGSRFYKDEHGNKYSIRALQVSGFKLSFVTHEYGLESFSDDNFADGLRDAESCLSHIGEKDGSTCETHFY
jgi:hypothetical protein